MAHTPSIWWIETQNVLLTSERRRRITRADTNWGLSLLCQLDVHLDSQPVEATLLALARRHSLTIYDALFSELSTRLGAPLATLDRALIKAAELEHVPLAN